MQDSKARDVGLREARDDFASIVNEVVVRGTITYLTNRGRRICALVPLGIAEAAEQARVAHIEDSAL